MHSGCPPNSGKQSLAGATLEKKVCAPVPPGPLADFRFVVCGEEYDRRRRPATLEHLHKIEARHYVELEVEYQTVEPGAIPVIKKVFCRSVRNWQELGKLTVLIL